MDRMSIAIAWDLACLRFFVWRHRSTVAKKIALCFAAAAFTGLAAQIRVPLASTPVPVTGQVFAVLLSGVFLGRRYGALSQVIYVSLGAAGVPWFAGWTSGALLGLTGGYLVGFIPAAALVGWFAGLKLGPCRRRRD
jgi:biotin transport system substrate-specific component